VGLPADPIQGGRGRSVAGRLLALLGLLLMSSGAQGASCKVKGQFTVRQVSGATCLSPVGFCAEAVFTWDLAGTSTFTGSSVTPTVATPTTGVILVTGDGVIQTKGGGTLSTKDAIVLRTTGSGDFGEVDTVIGGTGQWAGASGAFWAQGLFAGG
jgi:hypothetical protein